LYFANTQLNYEEYGSSETSIFLQSIKREIARKITVNYEIRNGIKLSSVGGFIEEPLIFQFPPNLSIENHNQQSRFILSKG
jgi:hypothetical protein